MRNIFIIFIFVFSTLSCTKDFLDKPVLAKESSDNFFNKDENVEKGVIAIYNVLRGSESYGLSYWVLGSIASDDAEAGGEPGGNDQNKIQNIDRLNYTSGNPLFKDFWFAMYAGIYRANTIIEKVEGNTYVSADVASRAVGQAYALRALFHFELVKVFGGVPIMSKVKGISELASPRNSVKEVLQQIESDLRTASTMLPDSWTIDNAGRISKGSALALLVKVLVFESSYSERTDMSAFSGCSNRWAEAKDLAEQIIAKKDIYNFDLDPDFMHIWRKKQGEISKEYLITANAKVDATYNSPFISEGSPSGAMDSWTNGPGVGCEVSTWQGCRAYYNSTKRDVSKIIDDQGWQLGYGFNNPTPKLFNLFDTLVTVNGTIADPRRDIGLIQDWKDSILFHTTSTYVRLSTKSSPTGYGCRKYVAEIDNYNADQHHSNGVDFKIYRYADFLLLAAEANFKSGNAARATEFVNMVRARARNSGGVSNTIPADLSTVTYEDILKERQMELACEGHRYFDLVRTGKAYEALNGMYNKTINQNLEFVKNKHEFFPIPDQEVIKSGYIIKQNPGY